MLRFIHYSFTSFQKLAQTLASIQATSSLIHKKDLLSNYNQTLTPQLKHNLQNIFNFIHQKPKTGIAEHSLLKFLKNQFQLQKQTTNIEDLMKELSQKISEDKRGGIDLDLIDGFLRYLIRETGSGSTTKKLNSIKEMVMRMNSQQGIIFIKIITKNLRIGLNSKSIKLDENKQSFSLMLAKPLRQLADIEDFCAKKQSNILADLKYDGERTLIVYRRGSGVELISRRNKPQTLIYKQLVQQISQQLASNHEINSIKIDGQILCIDEKDEPLPLQYLISQRGKQQNQAGRQVIFAFDILQINGQSLLNQKLKIRRSKIPTGKVIRLSKAQEFVYPSEKKALIEYFLQMIKQKHEGLILKGVDDHYYTNGTRKYWGKLKKGCRISQKDTGSIDLDLIVMGADFGQGKRSRLFSTFLLGVYHEGSIYPVSRVGTGFTDDQLTQLTKQFNKKGFDEPHSMYKIPKSIKVQKYLDPQLVFEVSCQNLTRSPLYNFGYKQNYGGVSLRFPVFERIRDDKDIYGCKSDALVELSRDI